MDKEEEKCIVKRPLLSIIVPGYNVEEFIEECLNSILDQTFKNYEVILIDDESPDNTGKIMDEYAAKYPNFTVIHKKNEGISVARNLGIELANGKYVAFVDSDDVLAPTAYQVLVPPLERDNTDISVGGVKRFNSKKEVYSFLHKKAVLDTVYGTTIHEHPELIYDTTVWNKVFRKSFLKENNILFPEGVIYEDIPFTMQAHLSANGINIIDKIVYKWRWREGENRSWTQQRNDLELFKQRIQAIKKALDLAKDDQNLVNLIKLKAIEIDIPLFIPEPRDADFDYLVEFQKCAYRFLHEIDSEKYLSQVLPTKQAQIVALMNGDIDFMTQFIGKNTWGSRLVNKNGKLSFFHESLSEKNWASKIDSINGTPLMSNITKIESNKIGNYTISSEVYPKYSESVRSSQRNSFAQLENIHNGKIIKLKTYSKMNSLVNKIIGRRIKLNFTINIDFYEIANELEEGIWKVSLNSKLLNGNFSGILANPKKGIQKIAPFIIGDLVIEAHYNNNWELTFIIRKNDRILHDIKIDNGTILLKLSSSEGISSIGFYNLAEKKEKIIPVVKNSATTVESKLDELWENGKEVIHIYDKYMNELNYTVSIEGLPKLNVGNIPCMIYSPQLFEIAIEKTSGLIKTTKVESRDTLISLFLESEDNISGSDFTFRMVQNNTENKYIFSVKKIRENLFLVEIPLKTDNNKFYFNPGKYDAFLDVLKNKDRRTVSYKISLDNDNLISRFTVDKFVMNVYQTSNKFLGIRISQSWSIFDNSKLKRKIIYSFLYPFMRLLPLDKNLVVYDSYWSSKINDNPKAMYEYLYSNYPNLKHVWFLTATNKDIDGPAIEVRKNSLRYWYYFARAKYLIENTNFPNQYSKRKGQIEVQTFHGTFMKTMGFDEPHFKNASKKVQNNFSRRNSRWDLAVSPSSYMTDKIKSAFNYEGEIIESGYPRNDSLNKGIDMDSIDKIKEKLKIPKNKKIILYAPTYRNKAGFDFVLNLDLLRKNLSDEFVILVRLHYFVANKIDINEFFPFAIDVSNYSEINDLYLISDCLITDYSSVMFDYGYLKRPMIFFAFDMEEYINDLRGIYLDYQTTVPGPIVQNNTELLDALLNLKSNKLIYQDSLEQFYQDFCEFGRQGNAAKIASERMLSKSADLTKGEPLILNKIKILFRYNKWYPAYLKYEGKKKKKNIVIFESFFGRKYSDNPKAIYEYLKKYHPEYDYFWNVNKEYVEYFKKNGIPYVERLTLRGVRKIARAKYWIINTRLPLWMEKPKGTILIQTWHGTPLKTLGRDVSLVNMPGKTQQDYHDDVIKDSEKWDYCLSPNKYSTEIFKRAFRLRDEQMINSGYPRNDILINYNVGNIEKIKSKLGIKSEKKVVLYAPTWRDNEYVKADFFTAKLHLDIERMQREFGSQCVILIRTHYLIANQLDIQDNEFAFDVSDYQDINDLYLISDILITDYSSVFFDYANLMRPIIFYTYDLKQYADEIRGFYFDFKTEAPGKIVEMEEDLYIELEKQLQTPTLSENYTEFVKKYCSWDSGNATEKAVSFVLGLKKYSKKKVYFEEQSITILNDLVLWSDVVGMANYKIIKNVVANNQNAVITEKANLIDPITGMFVGSPCYKILIEDGSEGWIRHNDFLAQLKFSNKYITNEDSDK